MPVSKEVLDEIALSEAEYEAIVDRLGSEPNSLELGMFGALWSEHCGYKHSKLLLSRLPSYSPRLLVMPGAENAGVVDIGDGLAVVMKIESHNHPSAVEPFQGAATGVGGIVRDIFAMGARPIALLNSLRFGPLSEPKNRSLFGGVVAGISWYGNCIGVPDVGGEVYFSTSYSGNPLVNAMCVGLVEKDRMVRAKASGAGNLIVLVGSGTGVDGIHGASGLASRTFEEEREMRPTVQVGNPFLEKTLIEACLEALVTGYVLAMQDLGAAGLTSAVVESVAHGNSGAVIDVARAPRREKGMSPYQVMLSESQERMLVVVSGEHEAAVRQVFDKWDLDHAVIGEVTDDGLVRVYDGDSLEASLAVDVLTDPPLYHLQGVPPAYMEETRGVDLEALPLPPEGAESVLLRLLSFPDIAGKEWIYRQYDHQVQTNTLQAPGGDAAVLRIKGTSKGIALSTDGNGRYCYLDPLAGGAIAVAEACRNLACVGAEPLAITDCLNFGNPERPEVYYQLEQCIDGMAQACEALGVPVISGNVSLYNETRGVAIWPTPVVGALGLLEDAEKGLRHSLQERGRRGSPPGSRGGVRRGPLPVRQRVPGGGAWQGSRYPVYRPGAGVQGAAPLPEGHRGRAAQLGPRLLRRRPGGVPGRVLHCRRPGLQGRVRRRRTMGRGAVRRSPVSDRGVAGPGCSACLGDAGLRGGCAVDAAWFHWRGGLIRAWTAERATG